jgi:hypothetical protein
MKFFGCYEDKDNRINLLRLLLIYLKHEDIAKECSPAEVISL